ncbi:unnamed protein product [Urochloa humidicola]
MAQETIHGIYQIKKLVLNIFFSVDGCNKMPAGFLQLDSECNLKQCDKIGDAGSALSVILDVLDDKMSLLSLPWLIQCMMYMPPLGCAKEIHNASTQRNLSPFGSKCLIDWN